MQSDNSTSDTVVCWEYAVPKFLAETPDTPNSLNNQPDALIIPILFCYKTLHVSGIFSAHHKEFSTVYSALVSFNLTLLGSGRQKPA